MADGKCIECGKMIYKASLNYCHYCSNKDKIESGGFNTESNDKQKKVDEWKKWYAR